MSAAPPHVMVACGVLQAADGRVLLCQRPAGKIAAGYWEFPGGKIEPGESPREALARELHEEIGIRLTTARPLRCFTHPYTHRTVTLDTWLISAWEGEPQGHEGQALQWVPLPQVDTVQPLLPTVQPILDALRLPPYWVITPPDVQTPWLIDRLPKLPKGALLRLRAPAGDYLDAARTLAPAAASHGLRLVLDWHCLPPDAAEAICRERGAWALHLNRHALASLAGHASRFALRITASTHNANELRAAQALDCAAALLSPVCASPSHPDHPGMGWDTFMALVKAANLPVYALGGTPASALRTAYSHYAQGVAGIGGWWP